MERSNLTTPTAQVEQFLDKTGQIKVSTISFTHSMLKSVINFTLSMKKDKKEKEEKEEAKLHLFHAKFHSSSANISAKRH